ncbi:phage tail tape measure protein [Halobacillus sp. H74]|uniref:phage tail tape measure protein n=1 Tax=Halobacillus sp. H74 TaxID=3457436 RepID=UPI003FCD3C42
MSDVGSANVNITADDSQARKKIGGLVGFLKGAGKTAAGVMGGVALFSGISAAIGAVADAGPQYEKTMSRVKAVTQATDEQMAQLEAQAKELGKTTKFSASQAAEAQAFLGQAGYKTNEILQSMPSLLDLAASGNMELGRAADIASNILSGFNLEASETGRVSDVLALSAASANTSVEQMGSAMSYVAPVAKGAGLSLEETAGAIGMLSNAGIQGERAGTALRGMISKLQSPTKATKDALKSMGLTVKDVNPATNSLTEILGALEGAGMNSAQAMELVGMEAGPGLLAMMNEGSKGLKQMTTELKNAEGAGKEMASTMSSNVSGNWKTFMSAMESVSIAIFTLLKPAINDVISSVTALARAFSEWLEPNIKKIQNTVGPVVQKLGEIVGAILKWKPLIPIVSGLGAAFVTLMIANKVAAGVALLRGAILIMANPISRAIFLTNMWRKAQMFLNATLLANPIGLVIAILVGLGVALVVAYKKSDRFREIVNNAWSSVKAGFQSFLSFFTTTLPAWYNNVISWFTNLKNSAVNRIKELGNSLKGIWLRLKINTLAIVHALIIGAINFFVNLGQRIMLVIRPLISFFTETFRNIKLFVLGIITSFISLLTGDMEGLKLGLLAIGTAIKNQALMIWRALKTGVIAIGRTLWNLLKSLFIGGKNALVATGRAIKNGVVNGFNALRSGAVNIFKRMVSSVISFFSNLRSDSISKANSIKDAVRNGFNNAKSAAISAVIGLYNSVTSWLSNVRSKFTEMKSDIIRKVSNINLYDIGVNIIKGLVNGLGSMIETVKKKAGEIAEKVKSATANMLRLGSPSREMDDQGVFTIQGLIRGMGRMAGSAAKKAASVAKRVKDGFAKELENTSAVLEDGDHMNDWLNHMNNQSKTKTHFIGKQLSKYEKGNIGGEVHNHQWNVNAEQINDVQKLIGMINGISQTVKSR